MRTLAVIAGLAFHSIYAVAGAEAQLRTVVYASGFSSPIAFEQDPSDPATQDVAEQRGVIRVIRNGAVQATPFLDISSLVLCCSERGLPRTRVLSQLRHERPFLRELHADG